MYAVYKQAHPPTGLEFSMYCNFFNNSERNLVVAGTSQLYVYRLNRDAEVGRPAPAAAPRGEGCPVQTERQARRAPWLVVSRACSLSCHVPPPLPTPGGLRGLPCASHLLFCLFSKLHEHLLCARWKRCSSEQNLQKLGAGGHPLTKCTRANTPVDTLQPAEGAAEEMEERMSDQRSLF